MPAWLGNFSNLRQLYLDRNQLTGELPGELGELPDLQRLLLGNNNFAGCIPQALKNVPDNDLYSLGLPYCVAFLSSLTVTPGSLVPTFDPNHTIYTVSVVPSRITVIPAADHDVYFVLLDESDIAIADADTAMEGLQVDFGADVSVIWIRVFSADGRATRTYVITSEAVGPCSDGRSVEDATNNPGLVLDCEALLAARDTLAGRATLNWSANTPIEQWEGVTVSGSPPRVTTLDLSVRGLTGELPTELGRLNNLLRISLWGNSLSGTVPTSLSNLLNLEVLALGDNLLTGSIPPELGNLTNLRELGLNQNQLTGTIPAELAGPVNLEILWLQVNQLTGEIPAVLGYSANLRELFLLGNRLTGEIPPELGRLNNLEKLALWENQLSGTIPSSLSNLVKLSELNLHDNHLTGTIPTELGNLNNLLWLDLSKNQLTGEVPIELASLTNLTRLYVSQNQLSGCIPGRLREVEDNDLRNISLPFCDVLLSGLTISPGWLVPPFDPYHTEYTMAVGQSQVALVPVSDATPPICSWMKTTSRYWMPMTRWRDIRSISALRSPPSRSGSSPGMVARPAPTRSPPKPPARAHPEARWRTPQTTPGWCRIARRCWRRETSWRAPRRWTGRRVPPLTSGRA